MSELNESNYKRIAIINWILTVPMVILFAWPYLLCVQLLNINMTLKYAGALLFSAPFMLTILHGHVTMALGAAHRHHYYKWMNEDKPLTFGLLFHPVFVKTRFRLILLVISLMIIPVAYLLGI